MGRAETMIECELIDKQSAVCAKLNPYSSVEIYCALECELFCTPSLFLVSKLRMPKRKSTNGQPANNGRGNEDSDSDEARVIMATIQLLGG